MAAEFPLYDLHSHFLPGIDDGCKTVTESIGQLENSYAQGIKGIFATPHYYHHESVDNFLEKRRLSGESLLTAINTAPHSKFPAIRLGAEVAFFQGISYEDDLYKLCLGNTNYILMEMPFNQWSPSVLRELDSIIRNSGLRIIIAHIERYYFNQEKDIINRLYDMDVLIQSNAEFITGDFRRAKKLLKKDRIDLLGSDCHNLTARTQNLADGIETLIQNGFAHKAREMETRAMGMFE